MTDSCFRGELENVLPLVSAPPDMPFFVLVYKYLEAHCNPFNYCLNYSVLAVRSAELLFSALETGATPVQRTVLEPDGFFPSFRSVYVASKKITLNVLLAQSQPASAIMEMTPQFTRATNIEVNYATLPLEELTTVLSQMDENSVFDVVRTNITTTPRFAEDALRPVSDDTFRELTQTMYPSVVQSFSFCHGRPCAVPFDISTYFYAYRKDLFTDPVIMRTYLENYGEELDLPKDFEKFNRIASFFCQAENPDSPVPYGTTGPANDMALIFTHFLFIYHNLGGQLASENRTFCFDRNKAMKAIRLQMELMPHSLSLESSSRDAGVSNFIQEKTALEIVSTSSASRLLDLKHRSLNGLLGFAPLPANTGTFGGGALAVPAGVRDFSAADAYIRWACGYEQAYLFTVLGGISPHQHVYRDYDVLTLYPWLRFMDETIHTAFSYKELDIFDRYQLERFMGFTLRNIYCGVIPIENCLDVLEQGISSYLLK